MAKPGTVKLSLELAESLNARLELAQKAGTSKSEIRRRGLGLYDIAAEARAGGNKIRLLDKDRNIITEIVGI